MTRVAGYPQGRGLRGDDSHGRLLPFGEQRDQMQGMGRQNNSGMQMEHTARDVSSDQAVPFESLAAGQQAAAPNGPLANTHMDAGMMGMMKEQQSREPRMSDLQYRNLNAFDMGQDSMKAQQGEVSTNANDVPNFPQDAYMEGTMMTMEKLVQKPENLGLRPNWSRFMQGMMTCVRVLPPEQYEQVVSAMRNANRSSDPYASFYADAAKPARS